MKKIDRFNDSNNINISISICINIDASHNI